MLFVVSKLHAKSRDRIKHEPFFADKGIKYNRRALRAVPEMNICPVPDIVSGSWHFVPVTCNSCRSSVYDILLKFENLPVIVTDGKRILSVTHKIMPDSDRDDRQLFHALP